MSQLKRHYVIGTAGHIDHGKTSLVKQLTGRDTDWLPEEIARGMTIDLGFAFLGDDVTIIDVPGHEKFIRNMVAGVSTIDLVLLVIAADDGVMPQTREHLDILKLLQIKQGIVVVTKIDLVEPDWLALVVEDIKELLRGSFLEQAPVIPVSNATGQGISELKQKIFELLSQVPDRYDRGVFRLPIDRVFSMKGFGTVVAGTVLSGSLTLDQTVELLPQQLKLRVRGLQIHEQPVRRVKIGDRAAVNLVGIEKEAIHRGDVLAAPDAFRPTLFFDGKFYLLESTPKNLKNTTRIRIHIGTNEVIGRVSILDKEEIKPGESGYIQFRLENPIAADMGDRYVVRSYSPVFTIGGGMVLDVHPPRHKRFSPAVIEKMRTLERGDPQEIIEQFLRANAYQCFQLNQISQRTSQPLDTVREVANRLVELGHCTRYLEKGQDYLVHSEYSSQIEQKILSALERFHQKNPTRRGMSRSDLKQVLDVPVDLFLYNKVLEALLGKGQIVLTDNRVALASHQLQLTDRQKKLMDQIAKIYFDAGFVTPDVIAVAERIGVKESEANEILQILLETEQLIKADEGIFFHHDRVAEAMQLIRAHFNREMQLTVGDFREMIASSRKYAVPLLSYFDSIGFTVRQQDVRVLNPDFKE
ncbi:MAG: selenocysteine-specific translation elongation factor [candidate division KSB1 bacterium]|nr:selenocysteine-specific translation elongation factor [candidate division KSB1 bacterium]MDZ7335512.1 selenocysteine-specific translation elongation factor [candidate division KSB1 bacterium]MDZ7357107.1 selenocysteine-specific translation elongation factor [candidate division KSB1 bacterium]MDZ7401769.1 selenocysteine-specific translation elongation factor [candidate division KSB1 bacterium]